MSLHFTGISCDWPTRDDCKVEKTVEIFDMGIFPTAALEREAHKHQMKKNSSASCVLCLGILFLWLRSRRTAWEPCWESRNTFYLKEFSPKYFWNNLTWITLSAACLTNALLPWPATLDGKFYLAVVLYFPFMRWHWTKLRVSGSGIWFHNLAVL